MKKDEEETEIEKKERKRGRGNETEEENKKVKWNVEYEEEEEKEKEKRKKKRRKMKKMKRKKERKWKWKSAVLMWCESGSHSMLSDLTHNRTTCSQSHTHTHTHSFLSFTHSLTALYRDPFRRLMPVTNTTTDTTVTSIHKYTLIFTCAFYYIHISQLRLYMIHKHYYYLKYTNMTFVYCSKT